MYNNKHKEKKKPIQHRPVVGFEEEYLVSQQGDIWSIRAQKYIKPDDNGQGYLIFIACKAGTRTVRLVHRVVAEAFIGPIGFGQEVNHKSRDVSNNAYWNLQILTTDQHKKFHRGKNNGNYGRKKTAEEIEKRTATRKRKRLQRMGLV